MVKLPRIRRPRLTGWPKLPLLSSVRGRIIVGFGLLVLILVVVVGASAWLYREHQSAMAAMEEHAATASLLQDAQVNTNVSALLFQRYVVSGDDTLLPEIRSSAAAAVDSLAEARAQEEMAGDDEHLARIDAILAAAASLPDAVGQIIALRQSGNVQGAAAAVDETASTFREFRLTLGEVAAQERLDVSALRSRADRTADLAFWLLLVSGAFGVGLGLAASAYVARSILKPLRSVEPAALAVAGGDLEARAPATGPREFARLGASLNRMTDSLLDASKLRELVEERDQAYIRLRDSEERFRLLVNQAADAIFVADLEGRFTNVNQAACDSLGYTREELLTLAVGDIADGFSPDMLAETFKRLSGGVPITVEGTHRRKDGTTFPAEIRIGLLEIDGRLHMLGLARDVTERKRAEEALRQSEERFRTLAETAAAAIFIFQGTRIRYVNPAAEAITGYSRQEWLAMNFWDAVHPDSRQLVRERGIARQRGQEIPSRYEVKLLTKKGEERWVDFTAAVIEFEGKPATLGTAFDITERKRAEEALRATKERLRHLLTASPAVIYSSKASGDFGATFISENVISQLGCEAREFVEDSSFWGDHIHPEDAPRIFAELSHLFERWHLSHEYRFLHKDGTYRWMHDEMKLVRDSEGNPLEIVGYWFDITEQRQAEEALRESEEWLSTTLTSIGDAVIATDQDGRVTFLNPVAQSLTGWKREDAAGMPLTDILNIVSEQTGKPAENPVARVIREGAVVGLANDTVLIAKDGTRRPIEDSAAPIRDSMGSVIGVVLVFHDVTERRRAEEALWRANQQLAKDRQEIEALNRSLEARVEERTQELRESEQLYRGLVETSPDAITLTDLDGKVLVCNEQAARLHGFKSMKGLAGRNAFEFVAPEDRQHAANNNRKTLETGSVRDIEYTLLRADGTRFPAELSASLIVDAEGNPKALIGVVREISERKRAEGELRLANEKLRQRHRDLLDARAQAATDALTDLSNHRAFHERIREEVRRAQETGSPIGLIMLDIDGFKIINDSQGHLAGDEILRGLAQTLADVTPREDAYRYGGDEFAVMLPGVDSRKTARVAERLRRAVERRISNNGKSVTVSLGIASFPDMVASADELIYGADAAMYWAKSAGKNRVGDWSKLLGQREGGALPWYAADRSVKAPDVVAALAAALAAKDPTTAGHTERCSWYALKLAEELGLPDEETSVVRLASLLHDIGKLAIPDEVLLKPGQLNEEEWAQMKQHPTAALHVLSHIRSLTDATPAILHHHEHFDGSGYPDGLAGEEIPIASRILLVTDAFDAMTTDRPYRKAMPIEVAIEELKRCSGSQFDPAIVDAFLSLLAREGAQPLRRMAAARPRPVAAGAAGSGRRER